MDAAVTIAVSAPSGHDTTMREVALLQRLRHPNIVSLHDAFRRKGKLYLVGELSVHGACWCRYCELIAAASAAAACRSASTWTAIC